MQDEEEIGEGHRQVRGACQSTLCVSLAERALFRHVIDFWP